MDGLFKWIDTNKNNILSISDKIWENPELAMQEKISSKVLIDWLESEGFEVTKGVSGMPTAFLAEYKVGSGKPIIGLLAEYDAMAGNSNKVSPKHEPIIEGGPGHGCAHNIIGTASSAAAIALKNEMIKSNIDGTIRVYGTPGEELLIAKVFMARDGLYDDCDIILTNHALYWNAANVNPTYALISTEFSFIGEAAHATSSPQHAKNALDAAILTINAANLRQKYVAHNTILEYVLPDGGYQPNAVPDSAKVWFFIRNPDVNNLLDAYNKLVDAAKGAAIATGTTFKEDFSTGCYGYLTNIKLGEIMYDVAKTIGPPAFTEEEKVFANTIRENYGLDPLDEPIHESLDFRKDGLDLYAQDDGDASWICPLARVGHAFPFGIPYHGWGFTAVSGSSIGHKGLVFCAKVMAATAMAILTDPQALKDIWKEHKERTKNFKYKCLVPDDVKPMTEDFMKYHVKPRW